LYQSQFDHEAWQGVDPEGISRGMPVMLGKWAVG
jgi:uncharacterized protein (DUF2235 family)